MFSFDLTMMKEPKPIKKKKQADPKNPSQKDLAITMKNLAKILGKEEPVTAPQDAAETVTDELEGKVEEAKEDEGILRCPSPNRSRHTSPKKRDESPNKTISLKANASEFVPPGLSSPAKAKSSLQAHA